MRGLNFPFNHHIIESVVLCGIAVSVAMAKNDLRSLLFLLFRILLSRYQHNTILMGLHGSTRILNVVPTTVSVFCPIL